MNIKLLKDDELISLRVEVEREMRSRGIRFLVGKLEKLLQSSTFNFDSRTIEFKRCSALAPRM